MLRAAKSRCTICATCITALREYSTQLVCTLHTHTLVCTKISINSELTEHVMSSIPFVMLESPCRVRSGTHSRQDLWWLEQHAHRRHPRPAVNCC